MNSAILTISGIKCDNPECNYRHDEVALNEYGEWLDRPCPDCGDNLLTEADYNTVKIMVAMVQIANDTAPANNVDEPIIEATLDMNGSGSIEVTDLQIKD
jgi:hypothetical protein